MLFNFLTIFPELISGSLSSGIVGQAIKNQQVQFSVSNLRDFTTDKHKTVDDKPFGGQDGMLMKPDILGKALESVRGTKILFPSPQGVLFTQEKAKSLAAYPAISFLCGRYAGIDQRLLVHFDVEEISIGDYVVSGGELPALIIMDAVVRHIPKVLGNDVSLSADSFANGLLEAPSYTRPQVWKDLKVPDALTSGHHLKIEDFEQWMSVLVTFKKRPGLLDSIDPESTLGKKWRDKNRLVAFYNGLSVEDKKSAGLENLDSRIQELD